MKSILYAGAALMICASIYGFIDYNKNSQNENFTGMYDEKKTVAPVIETEEPKKETVVISKNEEVKKVSKKQVKKSGKMVRDEIVSVDPIKPLRDEERLGNTETKTIETVSVDTKLGEDKPAITPKKKKKIKREIFSRAAIRDEEVFEKSETKKSVKKDQ